MPDATETIPPALTAEEWRRAARHAAAGRRGDIDGRPAMISGFLLTDNPAAAAALALDMLPDGDPRKLTWALVDALYDLAAEARAHGALSADGEAAVRRAEAGARAVAAILPPRDGGGFLASTPEGA